MAKNYDNWERLVAAVLWREHDRQLAWCDSIDSSSISSRSSSFSSVFHDQLPTASFEAINDDFDRHMPILLDGGKLSFSLDKRRGTKCFLVGARGLKIAWCDTPSHWEWTSRADSRFSEVAQLIHVCWLDIRGKIRTQMLSPNTTYGAYLVFKLDETSYGLESVKALVRFVKDEADSDAEKRATVVHLQPAFARYQSWPVRRGDGWMEIKMGSFYSDGGDNGEAEARLIEIQRLYWKSGLIVEGIEFRPKE